MIRPIDKLAQGDPSCFGSHRKEMGAILDEHNKIKSYCDQFGESPYHKAMMEKCRNVCDEKILRYIMPKKLKELGCEP